MSISIDAFSLKRQEHIDNRSLLWHRQRVLHRMQQKRSKYCSGRSQPGKIAGHFAELGPRKASGNAAGAH